MIEKELTLFDFMDQEKVISFEKEMKKLINEIKMVIPKLQQGESIQYKGRMITKDKFYEVQFENQYHELFYHPEEVLHFLKEEGVL